MEQNTSSPAKRIIKDIGGITETARALEKPISTVQGWYERDFILPKHWPSLIEAAAKKGAQWKAEDLVQ